MSRSTLPQPATPAPCATEQTSTDPAPASTPDLGSTLPASREPPPQLRINTAALPAAAWGLLGRQVRAGSSSPGGAAAALQDSCDSSAPASPSGRPARSAGSFSALQRSCLAASRVLQLDRLPSESLDRVNPLDVQDLEEGGDDFGGMPAAIRLTLQASMEPFELHPGPPSPPLSSSASPFLTSLHGSTTSHTAACLPNQEVTSASTAARTVTGGVQDPVRQISINKLPSFSLFLPSETPLADQSQSELSSRKSMTPSFEKISENHELQEDQQQVGTD